MTALIGEGMQVTGVVEHDSVPWEALPGQMTKDERGEWRLAARLRRLAASYTLQAIKLTWRHRPVSLSLLSHNFSTVQVMGWDLGTARRTWKGLCGACS